MADFQGSMGAEMYRPEGTVRGRHAAPSYITPHTAHVPGMLSEDSCNLQLLNCI